MTLRLALILMAAAAGSALSPPALAQTVAVEAAACRGRVTHQPDANVTYRPGHDFMNGQPVVPADVPGGAPPITVPETTTLILSPTLLRRLNLPTSTPAAASALILGQITVSDSQVYFNNQPLTNDTLDLICNELRR